VLDARAQITEQMNEADGRIGSDSGGDYWGGYYDACRHALKAIPPHLVRPDAEDLVLDDAVRTEPSPEPPQGAIN
jgi:hypothetical protein